MTITVLTGDCREILAGMKDESFDCILTDPPYNETALEWDRWVDGWPSMVRRLLKRTGSMWVFGSQRMLLDRAAEFGGWRFVQDVVWEKENGSGFQADRFKRVHENAVQFRRDDSNWADVYHQAQYTMDGEAKSARRKSIAHTGAIQSVDWRIEDGGPRLMRSVIYARSEHGRAEHPTQKPIAMVEPLLLYACPKGGAVLDCFAGSGTTGVVAARHGISATLIEGSPEYVSVIHQRLETDAPLLRVPA